MSPLFLILLLQKFLYNVPESSLKVRLNKQGSDYLMNISRDLVDKEIRAMHIPDFDGKDKGVRWHVKGVRIDTFTLPQVKTAFEGGAMVLSTSGGYVKGALRICVKTGFITNCGNAYFEVSEVISRIGLKWRPNSPKPQLDVASCAADIGDVSVKLHGSVIVHIVALFRHEIEKTIKSSLVRSTCPMLTKLVNNNLNPAIADLPSIIPLGGKKIYSLEYSNIKTNVGPSFLEAGVDVAFLYEGQKCIATMPKSFDAGVQDKMMTGWVAEGVPNCLLSALHGTKQLQYNIDNRMSYAAPFLRTTCEKGILPQCIGQVFSKLEQNYPNKSVVLHVFTEKAPHLEIEPKGAQLTAITGVSLTVPGNPDTLATFNINVTATILPRLQGNRIFGTVTVDKTTIALTFSSIGNVDKMILKLLEKPIAYAASAILQPIAQKGIEFKNFMGNKIADSSSVSLFSGYTRIDLNLAKA